MRVKHWSHKFFYRTICYNAWNTRAHKLHKFVERPVLVNSHNFFSSSTKWSSLHRSRQLVVDRSNLHTTNQLLHGLKCHTTVITPCTYARGKVIVRVVVVVIVVVVIVILDTKITKSGDVHVGTWASCISNKYVKFGEIQFKFWAQIKFIQLECFLLQGVWS